MVEHKPVLLKEALELLQVKKGGLYIDATLGLGGHSLEILRAGGRVLGFDVDQSSLEMATKRIVNEGFSSDFKSVKSNFKNIEEIAKNNGYQKVDGILFDLGYSSYELEEGGFGLSFQKDEPLDMRLDKALGVTAADLVNSLPEVALTKLIRDYSDERMAGKFARAIVRNRSLKKIQSTADLAKILRSEAPSNYEQGRIDPATRTFQALRIAVNDEIDNLRIALPRAARLLLPGGLIVVISFQSLEDKLVKEFGLDVQPLLEPLFKKPLVPLDDEILSNPRSRSAKLRAFKHV